MIVQSALVIGGGIGGMSAAIRLRQDHVPVDLIDIDPDWRVYGAGITITGPTLRAFKRLGLLDELARQGAFMTGSKIFLHDGTPIMDMVNGPVEPDLPEVGGIMRPVLHKLLSEQVRAAGVDIRLGVTATQITEGADDVMVEFSDGSRRRYDIVIAADGIFSATRAMLFPHAVKPRYTGQGSWRIVAPRPADMDMSHFYVGHANSVGIVAVSSTQVYLFILNPDPDKQRFEPSGLVGMVRGLLTGFGGDAATIRDSLTAESEVVYRPLEAALQPRPWHRGRVVLLGDAAHATTPHLASGAGLAVEDAMVLAEELARPGRSVPAALEAYTDRRFERCRMIVETSIAIGDVQLRHGAQEEVGALMAKAFRTLAQDY